jgi:hypothetical protein
MTTTLLTLTLVLAAADPSTSADKPRPKHSPYAPSLPYLTREEEDKLDHIIDQFMRYDIGVLRGEEGKKALKDFRDLKAEAIPALVRGLNRAAQIEHSCPVVVIAEKLQRLVLASDDRELLEFVQDNIGASVGPTPHMGVLRDLRFKVMLRKNRVAERPPAAFKPVQRMTLAQLADAASSERGARLQTVLTELEKRSGPEVLAGLANAARSYEPSTRQTGRTLLERHLGRQKAEVVKEKLRAEDLEVRKAAIRVAARIPALVEQVIGLLADEDNEVREAAHVALVRLNRGQDLGPPRQARKEQIEQAQEKWRSWLAQRAGR